MSKTGKRPGRETFSSGGQKRPRSWNSRPQLLLKLEHVLESHRRLVKQIVESHPCPQISDSTALHFCISNEFPDLVILIPLDWDTYFENSPRACT